jgi:hypothetical protein
MEFTAADGPQFTAGRSLAYAILPSVACPQTVDVPHSKLIVKCFIFDG